jgi:hypothetical protein
VMATGSKFCFLDINVSGEGTRIQLPRIFSRLQPIDMIMDLILSPPAPPPPAFDAALTWRA